MIFIDRSIPKSVATALKAVREDVIWLEDRFPPNTRDVVWLTEAGAERWLVITRDKRIRRRPGERAALMAAGVGCFILTQRRPQTRWVALKLLALTLDEMQRVFDRSAPPFFYAVYANGALRKVA